MINCLNTPDFCRVLLETGMETMRETGDGFVWADVVLGLKGEAGRLRCTLTAEHTPVRAIVLRWAGVPEPGARYMGDAVERGYGDLEWRGLNARRLMPWYFASATAVETTMRGVMTAPDAYCFWMADEAGITLWLDVRCGGLGVILGGKIITPAVVMQRSRADVSPYIALKDFCRELCPNPLLPDGPVFGSNNWYYAYGRSSARETLRDAAATVRWCEGIAQRPYVVLDDGWQQYADMKSAAGRPYECGNPRFPDMKGLAEDMAALGCVPGLWFRPLENQDRFVDNSLLCMHEPRVLDASQPAALELIAEEVERFADWGFKLLKYDFVDRDVHGMYVRDNAPFLKDAGWSFRDRSMTSACCMKALFRTIHDHAHGAMLMGCNTPSHLCAGYVHINRGGDDTSGMLWDRTFIMGVNTLPFRLCQHETFYAMDDDCVGAVENNVPWALNRVFLDLLAHSGTPLFVSIDPTRVTPEMEEDIRAAMRETATGRHVMEPLDWMESAFPQTYLVDGKARRFPLLSPQGLELGGLL